MDALYENGSVQQPPHLSDQDVIDARTLRRRQVLAALLHGSDARPDPSADVTRRGFVLGAVFSLTIAVAVGIAGLVDGSRRRQQHP